MPDINLIPEVLHQPLDKYNFYYDNLPLINILERQKLINAQVDINAQILRESVGTENSLANRLNKSINSNGSLKSVAVDNSLHNIAMHTDGSVVISGTPVSFVRMLQDERDKLSLISDDATSLRMQVNTVSTTVLFEDEIIELIDTDTVNWTVEAPNKIGANLAFPANAAHLHFYNRIPAHSNLITPNYTSYKTTSSATAYISGSLRVTINGISLNEDAGVYVPPPSGPSGTWVTTYFTSSPTTGTFTLNRAITSSDVIRIDFDTSFT